MNDDYLDEHVHDRQVKRTMRGQVPPTTLEISVELAQALHNYIVSRHAEEFQLVAALQQLQQLQVPRGEGDS